MPEKDQDDPFAGTARNLLLAFTALVAAALLLAHRVMGPRHAVIAVAVGVALLLVAALAYAWIYGQRAAAWIALATAFLASRGVMTLATTRLYGVRDALDHIYGVPLDIVRSGHIANRYTYSAYPALQILLAAGHFATGLPLWKAAGLLAPLLGLATLALVARTAEGPWPGSGLHAGVGFLLAVFAVPPGQLYQPLSLGVLCFAFLLLLVVRGQTLVFAAGLFFLGVTLLGLSHPYSAAIVGLILLVVLVTYGLVTGRARFLIPLGVSMALGVAYIAYVGGDLVRFIDLLQPNDVVLLPVPDTGGAGGGIGDTGTLGSAPAGLHFSAAYRFWGAWDFRLAMAAALAGWILAFWPRPLRAVHLQIALAAAGLTYLAARLVAYGLPPRVMTLSSVAAAPFIGFGLRRAPQLAALAVVAILALFAVTAPSAANQLFPWSKGDPAVHMFDDPAETAEIVPFVFAIQGGELRRSNPISSHPVFHEDVQVHVRSFSSTDVPGEAPHTHYLYREDSAEFGYSLTTTQSGNLERRAAFEPYPTAGQLALLEQLDRIGDFGSYHVERG